METSNPLNQISIEKYRTAFTDHYQYKMCEEGREDKLKREALGILIAQWCDWAGFDICEIFFSALEDSNFHTLNGKIEILVKEEKERWNESTQGR